MKATAFTYKLNYLAIALGMSNIISCSSNFYCGGDNECDKFAIKLDTNSTIDSKEGGCIYGIIENYSTYTPGKISLQSDGNSMLTPVDIALDRLWIEKSGVSNPLTACPQKTLSISAAAGVKNSSNFIIDANVNFPLAIPETTAVNLYYLDNNDSGTDGVKRDTTVPIAHHRRPLQKTPLVATSASSSVERLGFAGGKLLSLRSYIELMNTKKKFAQYSTSASALTQDTAPQGFIFSKEFTGTQVSADFADTRVVWLDVVPSTGLALVSCPTSATMVNECSNPSSAGYPNKLLPLDIKSFAISPSAASAAFSQADGLLRFAALPQTTSPSELVWAQLSNQPTPSRTDKVLLAFGDFDGNSTWDLIALHQDAQMQEVSVYLGDSSNIQLVYNQALSSSWQAALGSKPLSALAVGDLDSDGRADVAASLDSQVTVWINKNNMQPFIPWSAIVQKDVPVRALAIGQVDGKGPNDLVVASSTAPNSMGNSTQYLHAYLGQ